MKCVLANHLLQELAEDTSFTWRIYLSLFQLWHVNFKFTSLELSSFLYINEQNIIFYVNIIILNDYILFKCIEIKYLNNFAMNFLYLDKNLHTPADRQHELMCSNWHLNYCAAQYIGMMTH